MLALLPLACLLEPTPTTTESGTDSGELDTSADTAETGDTTGEVLWSKYKVDTPSTVRGVYSSGSGVYLVASRGQSWVGSSTVEWATFALPPELAGIDLNGLWAAGADETLELAVAADDGWFAAYSLGAWTVSNLGVPDNLGVGGTSLANLFVVGENGIQHWDGAVWIVEAAPATTTNAVWAWEGGAVAVGNEGGVYFREEAGAWTSTGTGKTANYRGVGGASSADIWAVGDLGSAVHWDGSEWNDAESGTTNSLNAIFVDATDSVLAVGNAGTALKYDGFDWAVLPTDNNQNLYAVHGVSGQNAWAGGDGGVVMQYKEND